VGREGLRLSGRPLCVESRCDAVALGSNISVSAPFVRRCLTGSTISPFSHPAHRTGQADFPHPALGQNVTPSPTARRAEAGSGVRAQSARKDARVDSSRPSTPAFVLELQPHRCVAVERPIRLSDGAYSKVVRPSAQRAVHCAHQLCGLLSCPRSVRQCADLLNHAPDALLRWPVTAFTPNAATTWLFS
jgi:hypothetical protein